MRDSDSLYHRLFAHPRMVEGLVREFIPQRLVADLDLSRLQRVNAKFHPGRPSARRREADVIWRVPIRHRSDIYLYLLLEFQSEVDGWMAARSQVYQGLLWQQVIDEQRLQVGAHLPPLLLLVLYNGEPRWKVATSTRELLALFPDSPLWPWQSHVRYYLLDMGAIPQGKLAGRSSLVALLFRLDRRHSTEELKELVDEVVGWFTRHRGYERLRGLFTELIREALARHRANLSVPGNLLEMKSMLIIDDEASKREWIAKGKATGLAEGMAAGKADALISLLAVRFGPVAPSRQRRIRSAGPVTLDRWFKRAIVAPDLHSVFNRPR